MSSPVVIGDVRKRAWETRRKKYGPRGHSGNYSRMQDQGALKRMTALIVRLHVEGILSEGQAASATGLHRIELRKRADEFSEIADSKYQNPTLSESETGVCPSRGSCTQGAQK